MYHHNLPSYFPAYHFVGIIFKKYIPKLFFYHYFASYNFFSEKTKLRDAYVNANKNYNYKYYICQSIYVILNVLFDTIFNLFSSGDELNFRTICQEYKKVSQVYPALFFTLYPNLQ